MHLTIGSTVYGNTYKLGALQKNACDNKRMPVITKKVRDGCMLERQQTKVAEDTRLAENTRSVAIARQIQQEPVCIKSF